MMRLSFQRSNRDNALYFIAISLIAFFVWIKAALIDMTHDEAYSFYNVKHFWWIEALCTGNTHWFNFAAIKLVVLFGFEKAGQLRWFTVVSAFVFLYVVYLWIRSIESNSVKLLAFSLLVLNPYMLDYFSLARGYASGLAFQALSLMHLYKFLQNDKRHDALLLLLLFGGLSAIANFNFFYFFVGLSVVYFFQFYFIKGFSFLKNKAFYLDLVYFIGICALVLKALWFITVCSNDIGPYGGDSFVDSLFSGYIKGFIYDKFQMSPGVISGFSYAIMVLVFIACFYGIWRFKEHRNKFYLLASIILLTIYVLCFINRQVFQVLYPVDRTTLLLFPLMALVIVCFVSVVSKTFPFLKSVVIGFSIVIVLNFFVVIRVDSTYDYKQQIDAKESFEFVEQLGARKVGISGDLYGVYRNYYQLTDNYSFSFQADYIETTRPVGFDRDANSLKKYDYLILYPPYNLSYYSNNHVQFLPVKMFNKSGTLILKVL